MKRSDAVGPDPMSAEVVAAERLVLAVRSTRSAEIGGEDSSLGDLIRVVVGDDVCDALALVAIELDVLAVALEHPSATRDLPLREFVGALARRAAASIELHRRLAVVMRPSGVAR